MATRSVLPAALLLGALLVAGACVDDDGVGNGDTTTTAAGVSTTFATTVPTSETTTSVAPATMVVQVFFLDEDAFNIGRPPYVVPVERTVDTAAPARGALEALFAGPTAEESAGGLRFVASEATGFTDLRIEDGTAHVTLTGGCSSGGSTFTIAEEIIATLRQFETVDAVRIYDPAGETGSPEPGDSIPFCLEP